jgi:hypothetical protein
VFFFVDAAAGFAEWCGSDSGGIFAWVQFLDNSGDDSYSYSNS